MLQRSGRQVCCLREELSLGLAFEQHLLGEGTGSWFFRPCTNLLCLHYHSAWIPTCKKVFHQFFFISFPNRQAKDVMSPSRCPLCGHQLRDQSGTSAINHPYRRTGLKACSSNFQPQERKRECRILICQPWIHQDHGKSEPSVKLPQPIWPL